jgi:hypothetical protein
LGVDVSPSLPYLKSNTAWCIHAGVASFLSSGSGSGVWSWQWQYWHPPNFKKKKKKWVQNNSRKNWLMYLLYSN